MKHGRSPRPHDLLRLLPAAALEGAAGGAPAWVASSLARAPWVVVRHGNPPAGQIAVGVRGATRAQRWAACVNPEHVASIRSPETLRSAHLWGALPDVPATATLRALAPALDAEWPQWGPTGSIGFSIASARSVLTPASDLDLLVRCPVRPPAGALDRLARQISGLDARVDCQVETPAGIAHLDDLWRQGPALMRTRTGVRMCEDPWMLTGS